MSGILANKTASAVIRSLSVAMLAGLLAACADDVGRGSTIGPTRPDFGKAPTNDPSVNSTSPDTGQQGATIDVQVNGNNFTSGAVATWALHGVADPNQVKTLATKFVNSRTLVATIAIGPTATLAAWDVQVALAGGKNGVGSELFTIKTRNSNATATFYLSSDAPYLLRGDAKSGYVEGATSAFAGMTRYSDGDCAVVGTIFSAAPYSGDGHLTMQAGQARKCSAFPRTAQLTFALINPDGSTTVDGSETVVGAINLHPLQRAPNGTDPGSSIAIGTSQQRVMHVSDATSGKCYDGTDNGGLAFRILLNTGEFAGADDVVVYRNSADTWTVTSMPDEVDPVTGHTIHHDKAYCRGNGKLYHMPLRFAIKSSTPLAP